MSSYDPLPEKLPSISMLSQQENDHNYNQDNAFSNFAHHSELYASNGSNHLTSDMSLDLYHQQHLSPPLTPAVSPSNMMDPAQFKRKYSVDVGTFGFNARPTMMHDQDYRRSAYSNMSVDGNVQQQQDHSLHHGMNHHNQQLNYYQHPQDHDNSYLIGDSPSLSGDTDNAVSAAHDSFINGDTTKLNKRTRLAQHYQQGPNAPHKHVCKFSECGWSFKRYEHLKRHMLVHTGERPHVCAFPGCGKSFSRSDNFHAHYRTHTKKQAGGGENQAPTGRRNSKKANGDMYLPMSASPSSSSSSSSTQQDLIHGYGSTQSFGFNNKSFEMPYQDMYDQRSFTSELQDQYSAMASPQPYMRIGMSSHSDVSSLLNHDQSPTMFTSNVMAPMYDLRGDYTGFHSTTGMPPPPSSPISSPSTLAGNGSDTINKKQRKYRTSLSHSNDDSATQQKSHICPMAQCQRRFKRLEHLKRHMRIHTLERPFACTFPKCHKHFSRSDNLSQHMKTHQHRTAQDKRRKSSTATVASSSSSTSSVSPRSLMDDFTSPTMASTNSQSTNTMSSLPSCWTLSESVGR